MQWFSFDNTLPYQGSVDEGSTNFPLTGGLNIDVDAIDFELTQRGQFRVWDWLATAGARYARASVRSEGIDFSVLTDAVWFGSAGVQFEGAGPTVSLGGERGVLREGLSIFARGRTSLLFGDTDVYSFSRTGGSYTIADDFVQVTEIQIGTQCKVEYQEIDLDLGIFWEAQRWDSDSNSLGDLGFHGFGVRMGFTY